MASTASEPHQILPDSLPKAGWRQYSPVFRMLFLRQKVDIFPAEKQHCSSGTVSLTWEHPPRVALIVKKPGNEYCILLSLTVGVTFCSAWCAR